ncbi:MULTISPECIES: carboxymuconolactone decarboxylase family protein [Bacillus]|uniref:Carboxymuconolactone decarboxylase family protein n=1 Tax=Bacillus glycinifermentans TaxID=1664069 RepID=A0AAJ3YVF6_9BACI|nr:MULTISPECIES: carboxymuconolactone decarboxylase family protein [Bacillus]KKB74330.1 alkylhydroperoxidase [Bacillus sp. TH008]MBU8788197.1 carboxymuconolactone decarboxylase family protein [Bacillus glycinifermentans]MDU0073215.1 carboxymuconolactone decarboxylase family protein [Bacillus sp. IG6]MED8021052.1 carboxymuconolactone decarboxylase family protein [Bacillus glycinifermentans]NUJ18370.1 carboxymuconolactone decarboxylase family protein [Bacillus glycinifermentans]
MTRINPSAKGETPFQRLLGHSDSILSAWTALADELAGDGLLSKELKEQVRRVLAQGNGCEYCKAKGKPEASNLEKTSLAMGFAEVFLSERDRVGDSQFKVLKEMFSDEEISELIAFICFTTAQQYFGALMKIPAEK